MKNSRSGIISTIVLIIIALIILGYFNIDFKTIIESPMVQGNFKYGWQLLMEGFNKSRQFILSYPHLSA